MITVSGNGSTWTENGLLQIGYYGSGTLAIAGGGSAATMTLPTSLNMQDRTAR